MSKRLDELSLNLASGMSRRRALQIFAGSLLAAVFVRPGTGALADDTGEDKTISDFCKSFCTSVFPGEGGRGLAANYHANIIGPPHRPPGFNGNYTSYGDCMSSCHACGPGVPNHCPPNTICIEVDQEGFSGNPVAVPPETFCIGG